jgi:hypothetical protein
MILQLLTITLAQGFVLGVFAAIWLFLLVGLVRYLVRTRRDRRSFNSGFKRLKEHELNRRLCL